MSNHSKVVATALLVDSNEVGRLKAQKCSKEKVKKEKTNREL